MSYILRKKGFLFFLIILLAAGGYFVFHSKNEQPTPTYQKERVASISTTRQIEEKDTDNDGLKDWEEILWKTDPNNPDTNGDGIKDGDEVKKSFVASAPEPSTNSKTTVNGPKGNQNEPPKQITNLTEALSWASTIDVTKNGQTNPNLDQKGIDNLANSTLDELVKYSINSKNTDKYNLKDLKITPTGTEQEVKLYANNLGEIIKKEFDPIKEDLSDILNASLKQKKSEKLQELEVLARAYKKVSTEMLTLNVPDQFKNDHLIIINNFDQIPEDITKIQKVLEDPALGFLGLEKYKVNAVTAYLSLSDINNYLAKNKIVFGKEEPANLFNIYVYKNTNDTKNENIQ